MPLHALSYTLLRNIASQQLYYTYLYWETEVTHAATEKLVDEKPVTAHSSSQSADDMTVLMIERP